MEQGQVSVLQVRLGKQLFGIDIRHISDIIPRVPFTPVPRSGKGIAGLINLRGHIVTLVQPGHVLGMESNGKTSGNIIVIEKKGELYGLLFDAVAEIVSLEMEEMEPITTVLDEEWDGVATGVFRLEPDLLVLLNAENLILGAAPAALVQED